MSTTRSDDEVVDLTPLIEAIGERPAKSHRSDGRPAPVKAKPPQGARRRARAAQVQDDATLFDTGRYEFGALVAKLNEVVEED